MKLLHVPHILPVYVEGIDIKAEREFQVETVEANATYFMARAIYYGRHHFTTRYVDRQQNVWYNDRIVHGRLCILEGNLNEVDMKTLPDGRECTAYLYVRTDT